MQKFNIHRAWINLACCCMMMGMTYGIEGGTTGNFFLPISETFGCTIGTVSVYVSIKGIASVLTIPFVVKLIKKGNIRNVLSMATIGYLISLLGMGSSQTVLGLYISAVCLGVSGSFLSTITVPTIINLWFAKKMSFALGIAMASSGILGSIASPVIYYLISIVGWRVSYFLIALSISICLLPLMLFVIDLKPAIDSDAYGGERTISNYQTICDERVQGRSFLLTIIFGITMALSTGILFNLPTMLSIRNIDGQSSSYVVSIILIGATVWKIIYGYLLDHLRMKKLQIFAIMCGVIGLLIIKDFTKLEFLFIGAMLYGSIVSLMTLLPPLMLKKCFPENVYIRLLTYVSMSVQLSYALAPMLFANLNLFYTQNQVIVICIIISLCGLIIGYINLKEREGSI